MRKWILMGVSILFGLIMINAGLNKFFGYMAMPEMPEPAMQLMDAFYNSGWLFPLVAIVEIIGGILFMINKWRALGALMLLPVVVGILLFHIVLDPATLVMALIIFVINIWAIVENKDKFLPLIKG